MYYNNGSFALSTTQQNNITFYTECDCPAVSAEQSVVLAEGWNWWAPTVATSLEALTAVLGDHLVQIEGQEEAVDEVVPGKMYKIKTNADCAFELEGMRPSTVSLSIEPGFNWFGYTGAGTVVIRAALNGITPLEGDMINSQDESFAIFEDGQWKGELTHLQSGHGYVYFRPSGYTGE